MGINQENSNIAPKNKVSDTLSLEVETTPDNQSVSKNDWPVCRVESRKTIWDRIVEGLAVLSSIAMVVVTVFLAIFAHNQWHAAEKQADAANKQVEAANEQIKVAKAQNDLIGIQADAANKQAEAANEQIKVAKAQNELAKRMNEEAKKANLAMNRAVGTYYSGWSDDVKDKIDLNVSNNSSRPTAILSINLRTKEGSIFRTVDESDELNLPLNIEAWSAKKISFRLRKGDREKLGDILVTDIDHKEIIMKLTSTNGNVKLQGLSMKLSGGEIKTSGSAPVNNK